MLSQRQFVEQCQIKYRWETIPDGEQWHDAHYPTPECLGGTETIKLWASDHAVQGVLQSEEYQTCCLWGWEKQFLTDELLDLYTKWKQAFGSINGKKGCRAKKRLSGLKAVQTGQLDNARQLRDPEKLRQLALSNLEKINKAWKERDPIEVSKIRSECRKGIKWWWNPQTDHQTQAWICPGPNYLNKRRPKNV